MSFSIGDFFPLTGSRRSAARAPDTTGRNARRSPSRQRTKRTNFLFESIESRLLLSADLLPAAAHGLADGFSALGDRVDIFLNADGLLGDRVPMLLKAGKDADGNPVYESPTLRDLLSVPVNANLDSGIDAAVFPYADADDDEVVLAGLDKDASGQPGHGVVDPGEFLQAWFFNPIQAYLDSAPVDTGHFIDFLKDDLLLYPDLDLTLNHLSGLYTVHFEVVDAKVSDTTEVPDAEYTFSVGFKLTITQTMPIDLGLSADPLKIMPFQTGTDEEPKAPTVPVTSTLSFAFDFGIHTGGEPVINHDDFFVRKAEPMVASVQAKDTDLNFSLNVGFLGAKVEHGSLDLQADVVTTLLDPNDPFVLGFTDAQHGVEKPGGSVTADNALTTADLAHEAGFFLRIGNLGIATPVTVADNNGGGDPLSAVTADIDAGLVAAGLGDLIEVSLDGSNKVRFDLVATSPNPLGFLGGEAYGLTGVIAAAPNGDGPNLFEYLSDQTFLLSVGGALPTLVRVNFPDPSHTDIGFNDGQAASVPPLVAPTAAAPYDITGNAGFIVSVWKNDGTFTSHSFTLIATDTDGNGSAADLAADIDAKLTGSTIDTLVQASADVSGHIRFGASDSSVSAIRVVASGTATSEIGFAADTTIGLQLLGAGSAVADLSEVAHFKLTLNDAGAVDTYTIKVPDHGHTLLDDLAFDINAAIDTAVGSDRINAVVSGTRILLAGNDTNVRSFSVRTINLDGADLAADVTRALAQAGLASDVTASIDFFGKLQLAATGVKSIEISKTLTFDAGVTDAELHDAATPQLFSAAEGGDSKVHLKLPVKVLPGLEDATTLADDDWLPTGVAIVGNFDPFASAAAAYDDLAKRFDLIFSYAPDPVLNQDDPPVAVPATAAALPSNNVRLFNFGELLNFNIVGAESMIGLLGGLGSALQQLAATETFAGFEIPFADATLSDLLNFADGDKKRLAGLIDMLLYDTGGDGVDGATLVNDADGLLKRKVVDTTSYLLPYFTTAQKLATRLDALLDGPLSGAGGINATYHKITNELTYALDLRAGARTAVDTKVVFENDVPLTPFSKLAIDTSVPPAETQVALRGRTGLDLTFGVDLSPPGVVIYPATPLAQLNGGNGIDARVERALTGETGVRSVFGISRDSKFKISVDGGTAHEVVLTAASTANNLSIGSLVADLQAAIDAALGTSSDAGKVNVGVDAATLTRLGMQHVDAGHTFQIYVNSSDPFVTELGFANKLSGGVPTAYEVLIAQKAAPLLVGRLSGTADATFEIDILKNRDGSANPAAAVPVKITVASTSGNSSAADLVADVDNALAAAGLKGMVKAAFDNSSTLGTRLVLVAGDDDPLTDDSKIEFTVRATNTKAHDELGLPNVATAANKTDFVIYDRAGVAHAIVLDPTGLDRSNPGYDPLKGLPNDPNVSDLNKVINAYFPDPDAGGPLLPLVVASLNGLHTGMRLSNNGAGGQQFRVETINDSGALIGVGLFLTGDDKLPDTFDHGDPNLIEGGGIGLTSLDERFFVRNAQLRIDGLEVKTPGAGVPGQGLYGIVGVDTVVSGGLIANVTAQLTDPGGPKSQITLAELLGRSVELAYGAQPSGAEFAVGGVLLGSSAGDSAVIIGIKDDGGAGDATGTLVLADVKGAFSVGEPLSQKISDTLTATATATGSTVTVATPVVSPVVELNYDGQINSGFPFGEFAVGGLLVTATPGDTAVIVGVRNDSGNGDTTGKLLLAHVKGTFADNEQIGQLFPPSPNVAAADANGTPSPAVDFGHFELKVRVQPGFDDDKAFDADFAALDNAPYTVPFDLSTFGNGLVPPGTSPLDLTTHLGELKPFDKLSYVHFKSLLGGLQDVLELVEDNFGELTVVLPAINRSVSDLLGLIDPFARGVDNAGARLDAAITAIGPEGKALPALTLQQMGRALRGAFGLPDGIDPAGSGAVDWVRLDYDKVADELLVSLQLHEGVSTKLGLDIDPPGPGAHLTSAGVLEVSGNLDVRLDAAVSLAVPNNAYLLDTSHISGDLHVQGEGQEYAGGYAGLGMVFRSTAGPLAVFIQDGDALIDFAFSLPGLDFGVPTRKLLSGIEWPDFMPKQISADTIDIVLPMFYGGEGPDDFIGEYKASGTVTSTAVTMPPDLAAITAKVTGPTTTYDPFDNILLAVDALDLYLETLSDQLSSDVLGINLPFVGDQMGDVLFIEDFRSTLVRALKNGIENAINPTPATVTGILNGLFGPGGALDSYVADGSLAVTQNLSGAFDTRFRQWKFTLAHTDTITIDDFDIGPDNLGFDVKAPVTVSFDWSIVLGFGVSYGEGAYIDVSDGGELDLDLTMSMPGDMAGTPKTGEFGFMQLGVTDPGPASGAKLFFDVDVKNEAAPTALRLGFADLGSMIPAATLSGDDLGLGSNPIATFHLKTNAAPGLPDLQADFVLDWALPTTDVATLDGDAVTEHISLIQLNNISLDAYSAAKKLLGPAFDEVARYIEPFMPVVDLLTEAIPILSDLAGEPFTILDLAAIFGDVNPDFIDAVADILDVIHVVGALATTGGPVLPLGSLTLWDTGPAAITTFDPGNPAARTSNIAVTLGMSGLTHIASAFNTALESDPTGFLVKVRDGKLADGLKMPILTQAEQGIMLLLGNPVATLIDYALPPLAVSFEYLQVFPVWGPLAVSIEINFGFTVDLHSVGFDTYGYMRYADTGFRNPGLIFDGFYFNDAETEGGPDAPEVTFEFGLVGAAELNIGIARAGVGGGIQATINFDWHDSVPDGHVHISELIGNVIAEGGNPLAVFDVGGKLTFQMFAFLEIKLLGIDEKFPITPETELFSFDSTFTRAPRLATKEGDTLYLNMGPNAIDRLNGDTSDGNETLSLKYEGGAVKVWSDPLGVGYGSAQSFSDIKHIVGIGGEGNDTITLEGFDGSKITGDFDGGVGDDRIEYTSTSASNSWAGARIVGGLGNDTLTGGDANDTIFGGVGNDVINGSGGFDILFGDQGRRADTVPKPFISSRITLNDGEDTIHGGAGDDVIFGAGGSDHLSGDAGNDLLIGDGGRFEYSMVDGHVNVAALRPSPPYTPAGAATWKDPALISAEIDALSDFVLARVRATELGLGGNDVIAGGGDDDLILGGSGDDSLAGDGGADFLLGGKGFDDAHGGAGNDTIFGGDQADTLYGDADHDVMAGGAGNDFMHGDAGNDVMKGDTGADIMFGDAGDDQVFGLTEPDVLFGGIGNDLVVGGTGNDTMFGDDGIVAKLKTTDGTGLKVIGIGFGGAVPAGQLFDNDRRTVDLILTDVVAGDGNDMMSGDAGDDLMLAGGGNDLMGGDVDPRLPGAGTATAISEDVLIGDGGKITFNERRFRSIETVFVGDPLVGTSFDDTIYGDNGNDYLFGGRGSDFLFGGHGKVVTGTTVGAFRGATDTGADDNDIIVGDNGEMIFAGKTPVAANFGTLELVRTTDITDLTGGHEYAEGELDNDVIFGGVNGSVDVLFGNAGSDVILGDNGELDFDYLDSAHNLDTLDLIRSYRDGLGGIDQISGNAGGDVLIGGTAGDEMYGDSDGSLAYPLSNGDDGEDIMLGDNADIFLIGTTGRLKVKVADMLAGTAVDLITTSDRIDLLDSRYNTAPKVEAFGGADTMSGNAGNDIMLGGVNNDNALGDAEVDRLYGDRAAPTTTTIANDSDDILLGDNGLLDFTFSPDTDRDTLDLIRSFEDGLGGTDELSGNKGLDVGIGGTGDDTIYGDDSGFTAGVADLADILLGDNADVFLVAKGTPGGGDDLKVVLGAAVKTIRTTDEEQPGYGGVDTISGNARGDIIAGGVKGDYLYGDRATPTAATSGDDGNDIMLGDNGALEWLSDGRLAEITGIDIAANNPALAAHFADGADAGTDPDADTNLATLDLITTEQPTRGGRDRMWGDEGSDLMFGGTDLDVMFGDDGDEAAETLKSDGDLMFGDHGRVYPQFSFVQVAAGLVASAAFPSRNFFAIDIGNAAGGEGDEMWGEEGDDVMLGQQGDDRMWGGSGNDDMVGGHNVMGGWDELGMPVIAALLGDAPINPIPDAMNDAMDGGSGDDAMAGDNTVIWRRGDDLSPRFRLLTQAAIYTTTLDTITVNVGTSPQSDPNNAVGRDIRLLDHSDAVLASPQGRFGNDVMAGGSQNDVMFGQLGDDLMQGDGSIGPADADPVSITRSIGFADGGSNPDTDQALYFNVPKATSDGDDYMEGNGGSDLMYGGLGQDDMIGGSSALFGLVNADPVIANALRPDSSDTMFGGAGIDIARNHIGDAAFISETVDGKTSTNVVQALVDGHARDADFMMGDNANLLRLVTTVDAFHTFVYDHGGTRAPDVDTDDYDGTLRIVPRAMQQLDYTLGGNDYAGDRKGNYVGGAADLDNDGIADDNGAADLIHGESGDDIVFGMTGSDVLFGEGQNDDIVGGYGHDWISGGTGQDGVLGDDGLVYTSRNSAVGEPLNGVAGLKPANEDDTKYSNGDALDEKISTPGSIQTATINVSGELKKTVDLVPFSDQYQWAARDDEFPDNADAKPYADDIIFGGWGSDWLHGGSGDDAISGAEALQAAYTPDYNDIVAGALINLGYDNVGVANALVVNPTQGNPGNVLFFHPEDTDGQHLNNRFRAGEFDLYDEYNPRVKILLDASGKATLNGSGSDFLLNFRSPNGLYDADFVASTPEGVRRPDGTVPKATGQQTESYPKVDDDGADAIFGDLGNDWLVGGTGRDNVYGGWGNDLLQVDDYLNTETVDLGPQDDVDAKYDNEKPDTHPTYEDRAYGGAGRDVLIGNTGGDRLIDWVGEYNSYIVPYAPFGQASVSRTLQPFLPEFLYALSAGDGADPTRYRDAVNTGTPPAPTNNNPIPTRFGEPYGELGLVLQKDFAWGDQTGAPADPQAGNIPGGPRDVLRSADFAGNNASGFVAASGTWQVVNNAYEVAPAASGSTDAISLFNSDVTVPSYFEITATINAIKPVGGFKANAYVVFDYYGPTDFKFAGINISTNKIEIGQRSSSGFQVLASANMLLKAGIDYNVLVAINGSAVQMVVNNAQSVGYAFAPRTDSDGFTYGINAGMYGLGADNAKARIDNVVVQRIPPKVTLNVSDDFSGTASTLLTPYGSGWNISNGRFVGTPSAGAPFAIATNDIAVGVSAMLKLDTVLSTTGTGGVVFDLYSPTDFKWAAISKTTNQVLVGHYTAKAGWVVDMAVSRTLAAGDNTLSVTLKDTTVTVSLNGQLVLSRLYNGTLVDGAVGTFSRGGTTSFDSFTMQSDDAKFATTTTTTTTATTSTTSTMQALSASSTLSTSRTEQPLAASTSVQAFRVPTETRATQFDDFTFTSRSRKFGMPSDVRGDFTRPLAGSLGVSASTPLSSGVRPGLAVPIAAIDRVPQAVAVGDADLAAGARRNGDALSARQAADAVEIDWGARAAVGSTDSKAARALSITGDDWRSAFVTNLGAKRGMSAANSGIALRL